MTIHASLSQTQEVVHTAEQETLARGEKINSAAAATRAEFDELLEAAS